ncbi:hypothetical protein BDB00DRAFT_82353 [Zychaea mexicana]|uniref:uncharacterized protein n=1 Tax=Zychaea mexicana TaxID=64656 RepID=UPI0022FE7FB1|nr:uncharacterized protein BDB00DRAFT_82353 [Zychaea mexicana]KAI9487942.1 hypothetical protein BDB00DRAFT_82353 [Zychaea mexicana]
MTSVSNSYNHQTGYYDFDDDATTAPYDPDATSELSHHTNSTFNINSPFHLSPVLSFNSNYDNPTTASYGSFEPPYSPASSFVLGLDRDDDEFRALSRAGSSPPASPQPNSFPSPVLPLEPLPPQHPQSPQQNHQSPPPQHPHSPQQEHQSLPPQHPELSQHQHQSPPPQHPEPSQHQQHQSLPPQHPESSQYQQHQSPMPQHQAAPTIPLFAPPPLFPPQHPEPSQHQQHQSLPPQHPESSQQQHQSLMPQHQAAPTIPLFAPPPLFPPLGVPSNEEEQDDDDIMDTDEPMDIDEWCEEEDLNEMYVDWVGPAPAFPWWC